MALKDGFRVKETSATVGTGTLTLAGAPATYLTFLSEIGEANTCYYQLFDADGIGWEVGLGTITGATLTRTVLRSSNANAALVLTAGTHTVVNAQVPGFETGAKDFGLEASTNMLLQSYDEVTPTPAIAAGVLDLDFAAGRVQSVSLTENVTSLTFSNLPASGKTASLSVKLAQDATGARTFAFPAAVKFSGGAAPTLSAGASEYDWLTFITLDGGTTYDLFVGGQAFA